MLAHMDILVSITMDEYPFPFSFIISLYSLCVMNLLFILQNLLPLNLVPFLCSLCICAAYVCIALSFTTVCKLR
jgi:hypothetical protein